MVTRTLQRANALIERSAYRLLFPHTVPGDRDVAFLRPLMTPAQKGRFFCLTAIWCLMCAGFWAWWVEREHVAGATRFFLNTLLLLWSTLSPGYFVLIFWRSRVAAELPALPTDWRVAMVVTKAPSEPFEVVRKTLEAMLGQAYPHDTWIADEDPSPETIAWCRAHGVRVSTRRGVESYQRASWPRRARCKEGNLAYFYDHYGYQLYDFVAQLDADHVPEETYLIEMLKPFRDPRVGYVSAPSICDSNADASWAARGRLHVEGGLHGALQAGYNGGLAPLCIGSHYAVRTQALREIGGLGPELAEDHSTTLVMNAHDWRGVHAFDAIAHGEGPPTFAAMITQEFQWARSLSVILFRYMRDNWPGLSPRLKAQFLFSQLWYPIFSVFMACSVLAPIVALLTRRTWVAVLYPSFFVHSAILTLAIISLMAWVRRNGWFRPRDAKVLSWEGMVFTFARWPWSLLGVLTGVYAGLTRRELPFRVTPKGGAAASAVPPGVVLPYLALSAACALPVLLIDRPGTAVGFYVISLANALIYLVVATVIIVMHRLENPPRDGAVRHAGALATLVNIVALLGTAGLLVAAGGLHLRPGVAAIAHLEPDTDAHAPAVPGVDKPFFRFGVYDPQRQLAAADNLAVEHVFVSWADPDAVRQVEASLAGLRTNGRWLLLTIEPFAAPGLARDQLLQDVAAGRYDGRIDALCGRIGSNDAIASGRTGLFLRWGHEMDHAGSRYPWQTADGKRFVEAYRHVVTRCRSRLGGAKTVYFVWSPAGDRRLARYYPGSAYVDWIGLSVYSCTACKDAGEEMVGRFEDLVRPKYRRVRAYGKPVMVAEMGIDGPDQRAWLADALRSACALPHLRLLVYFNAIDQPAVWGNARPDWHLSNGTRAAIERIDGKAMCPQRRDP